MAVRTARIDLGSGYALVARLDSGDLDAFRLSIHSADGTELDYCEGSNDETVSHPIEVSYLGGVLRAEYDTCCIAADCPDNGDPFVYLGSDVGTSRFDSFSFAKGRDTSEPKDGACERPVCPETQECDDCCDPSLDPPGVLVVDFGLGGWVYYGPATTCDSCAETAGEFILLPGDTCTYNYGDSDCDFGGADLTFGILARLEKQASGPDIGKCRWKVAVSVGTSADVTLTCNDANGDPVSNGAPTGNVQQVTYFSDYLADDTHCADMPVTLEKTADSGLDGTFGVCPCGGDLPDFITLDSAV